MREYGSRENDERKRPIASTGGWCTGARGELSTPIQIVYTKFVGEDPDVHCDLLSPQDTCEGTTETPEPRCIFFEKVIYEPQARETLSCNFDFGTHSLVYNRESGIVEKSPLLPEGHDPIEVSHAEGEILEALMERRGKIITSEQLFERYAGQELMTSRAVDVHVSRLRGKLGQRMKGEEKTPSIIETRRNVGYYIPRASRNGAVK